MAVKEKAKKRRRKNNNFQSVEQTNDRLSSLHDDILIVIISCLPLRSAVVTGLLSRRWRGLWKNISSIIISDHKSDYKFVFSEVFLNVMRQIKSPFIHRFHLEFDDNVSIKHWQRPHYSWLRRICNWNVRELNLTWTPYFYGKHKPRLPSYVFQTRSLVSIELDSTYDWELLAYPIILPNLKKLSLSFCSITCECLGMLIKSCLLLEELSLTSVEFRTDGYLKCSNQNLRRLFMYLRFGNRSKVVINAPKLEYLDVCASIKGVICLDEEPIALREAKHQISENHHPLDDEKKKLMSKFYEAISSVAWITLNVAVLGCISTVFCNVTRLTLKMKTYPDILDTNLLLSLLKLCPLLDVFTLKLEEGYIKHKPWLKLPSDSRHSSTLNRVLKRVEVEIDWWNYRVPSKSFVELVGFLLLSNTIDSKHFHFRLCAVRYCRKETEERIRRMEMDLCKIFHQAPMVSKGHEVEFVGEFYKLSRNACRKFSRANREIIYFSCSQPRIED
ncbi:F-box protein At4g09920-like [Silene latifolia]|uniref:F-box protein At4g09920-like n=1 Tax=Silene latifolia TaxID=37657 RepID=UPI003D7819A4